MNIPKPESEKINFNKTVIPDKSSVRSCISLMAQVIRIEYSELEDYFAWIQERVQDTKGVNIIKKGVTLTMANLKPGLQKWLEIAAAGEDVNYTLGRCIREEAISCFHRSVFLNLLMQKANVDCRTIEGHWVESEAGDLTSSSQRAKCALILKGGYFLTDDDQDDAHLFNIVYMDEKYYLVDASYLVEDGGKHLPVIAEIDYQPGKNYYAIKLPNGKFRHYIIEGDVKVRAE